MTLNRPIALIADRVSEHDTTDISNTTLEFVEESYFQQVTQTLQDLGREVLTLDNPSQLVDAASALNEHTVLPLWSGENSRSRRALCASICESAGLTYLGADAYSAIVCQDKALSKDYARRFGIQSAPSVLIDPKAPIPNIEPFDGPYVVKPLFEGGSIGIDQNSLCHSWAEVCSQVARLRDSLETTIMVEGFLEGDEISICMMGRADAPLKFAAVRLEVDGFDLARGIWSMEVKKSSAYTRENIDVTEDFEKEVGTECRALYASFEKIDFIRIDGRMTKGGFKLIELTPDVHLGAGASFAQAMELQGVTYEQMWQHLLEAVE